MGTTYEIWRGRKLVAFRNTEGRASEAVIGYLVSAGCREDEIVRRSKDSVTLRGTIYRAVTLGSDDSSPENVRGWAERLVA